MQAEVLVHRPVLAEESPRLLVTDPNGVYVDGTFGRGGHSRLILEKLSPQGRLIAKKPLKPPLRSKIRDFRLFMPLLPL